MTSRILLVVCLLILGSAVNTNTQETCPAGDEDTTQLRLVVQQLLVDVTTQYFADTAIGADGFPLVDASLRYGLFDLFEERYGSGTSTAEFMAGLLDILGASQEGRLTANDHLAAVIGLAARGDYDSAREETILLIYTTLEESVAIDATFDYERLTTTQVVTVYTVLRPVFVTIRNSLTSDAFERYLSLAVGSTLALVMDTTGSMSAEIAASQARFVDIIATTRGTVNQPLLYVLSPYNDPAHGPVTVTTDPSVITDAINALRASGGGDVPELAGIGIYDALLASTRRSVLFHITDAPAKDVELETRIIALALIRKIRIINLLTQEIPAAGGQEWYSRLSRATGGLTTVITRADITSVTQLFTALTSQGQVILAFNTFATDPQLTVPCDQTLDSLTIRVAGAVSTAITSVTFKQVNADGVTTDVAPETLIDANGLYLFRITGTAAWAAGSSLQIDFAGNLASGYSVEVSAFSVFGTISHVKQSVGGTFVGVDQFRAGATGAVDTNLFGDFRGVELVTARLQAEDGSVLVELDLDRCRDDGYYVTPSFTIPTQRFFIVIVGRNADGVTFQRSDPCAITPVVENIQMTPVLDQIVNAGDTVEVTTTVSNNVATALQFTYDVADQAGFVANTNPVAGTIGTTTQQVVTITITVPADTADGTVSRVTAIANPVDNDDFLFISFNIIVINTAVNRCTPFVSERGGDVICTNGFNNGSLCDLTCQPGFVVNGPVQTECVDGVWSNPRLTCDEVGFQQCQGAGDPHYLTFDGQRYDFMGTCVYTLVETTFDEVLSMVTGLQEFKIQVENEHRGGNTRVSWFKQAFVRVHGLNINIRQGRKVIINGLQVNLPFSLGAIGLNIELSGNNVLLTTRFGLEVRYNGNSLFVVKLSGGYANQVQGLCGNMDGDASNDLTIPGQDTPSSENDYGDHFQIGGVTARCTERPDGPDTECENREEYEALCGIIDGDCFEACRAEIPTPGVLQNCLFDLCVTEGNLVAYEQAIAEYAQQCQLAGFSICDWREPTPICPPNSHWEHEAVACPNTCRSPNQAARCARPKVSGCVCDDGFVLSGDVCVPQTECGCSQGGQYYMAGQTWLTAECAQRCTCNGGGALECVANTCPEGQTCQTVGDQLACAPETFAECQGNGDPHYVSFDGTRFDYMGVCRYTLVDAQSLLLDGNLRFTLEVENEHRGGNERVSWLKEATFRFYHARLDRNITVVMNRDDDSNGQALVTGLFPAGLVAKVTGYSDERVDIQSSNRGVVIQYGSVTIEFKSYLIKVTVPSVYQNRVSGLCGAYNDDATDDLTNSTGVVVTDWNQFGDSFIVGGCEAVTPPPNDPPCAVEDAERWGTNEFCGVITAVDGPFAGCAASVDLLGLYDDCLYDMCLTDGDLKTLSEILTIAAAKCGDLVPCNWRADVAAVADLYVCPENSIYSGCAPACPNTCFNPLAEGGCARPAEEGCVCKLGYVQHDGKCVKQTECGCFTADYGYVQQGFSRSNEDCTERCSCKGPGNFVCEAFECVGLEQCTPVGDNHRCIVPAERCLVWGSYVKQFDDFRFNFDRVGRFVAIAFDGNDDVPAFTVEVVRGLKHPISEIRTARTVVRYWWAGEQQVATIYPGSRRAFVNKVRLLPGSNYRGVRVIQQGLFTTLLFDFGDLIVRGGFQQGVVVSAGGLLLNHVSGLCGTWNNDITDDQTDDVPTFIDGLSLPDLPDDDDKPVQMPEMCIAQRFETYVRGPLSCGLLSLDTALLSTCHTTVPFATRLLECVHSLTCNENNYLPTLEASLIGYLIECIIESEDPPVVPIRENTGIQYVCPQNSHYVPALTECPKTCADRDGSICEGNLGLQRFAKVEGCECDEGFIWSGYDCVPEEYCGCVSPIDGIYFKHGECYTGEGCSQRCQCRSGAWECEDFRCYRSQTCGLVDGLPACISVDKCKLNNGGCGDICTWDAETDVVVCSCSPGTALKPDFKGCVAVAPVVEGFTTRCSEEIGRWRESYAKWKSSYDDWSKEVAVDGTCATSCVPTWELEGEVIGGAAGAASCDVYWSEWFDSDDPDGCGDDETIERLRDYHPDLVCDTIVTMEKRIVAGAVCDGGTTDKIVLRTDDRKEGLFCDNADQELGVRCPDYAVRFLCVR